MTADLQTVDYRLEQLEGDVKTLYERVNSFAVSQAAMNTKLDNLFVTLGELKESVNRLNIRPAQLWDKLVSGFLGAAAAGIAAAVIGIFIK